MTDPVQRATQILSMSYRSGVDDDARREAKARAQALREQAERRVSKAREVIEQATGPVKAVFELHAPHLRERGAELACNGCDAGCNCDITPWPCSTWRVLTGTCH